MYCWHLLLLALLCYTPPSISERFNGRHCCDQPPDNRLLSYRRLLDKPSEVQGSIRGPDIGGSRWKDERDIEAYRRTSEEKSGERYERNVLGRRTERDAGFNRFDTRENRVRKDARNTLQRIDQRRETSHRFDSRNRQMHRVERNLNAFDRKIERQTTREDTERRQSRSRYETRQDNRNEVLRSREFEHIDNQRRFPTKRINNIRVSNLPIREIRAVRRIDDNRVNSHSVERMARDSRMPRLATDRRDTRFVLDRRSPLDSVASRRFSHFPTLTRNRLAVSSVKDDHEPEIRRTEYRGTRSDRHLSSLRTNIRTARLQERDSRRISERDSTRASLESSRRSENLSRLTRELRRIELDENRPITRSIPQNDRQIYDNERGILRTPTRQIETERSYAKHEYRPSQERDIIRNDRIRREFRIPRERRSTVRSDDQRSSRTPSEPMETQRLKFERYDSERRNIPSEANSRRDSGVVRQLSRFSTERRVSAFKRVNTQYGTEPQSSRLSERLDTRSRHVSHIATDDNEGRFNVNNRHSRAVSETRRSVERIADLRRENTDTRLKRSQMSWDTTDRENRRYSTDNRLVRDESDARLSNVLNRQRENRKLSSSMDRVDMRYIRERQDTRARINERHSMEPKLRFVAERPETRRNQNQRFGVEIRQSRSLSDLESRVPRRIENTARFSNSQQIRMIRETEDVRRNNERNMESRLRREQTQVRRSLHRDVAYTLRIESARRNSDARSLLQNARQETERSRNLNSERLNVRRDIDELSQRTSGRIGYDRTVRDLSRYERRNVKSRLTTYATERHENRRNGERRFRQNENRISDSGRSEDMRRENGMSDVTERETILRKLSEHITTRTDNIRNINRISERDIRERRTEERAHNQNRIVRKISERVKSSENLQNSRTILKDGRDLSRFVRFDRRQIDTQSINRQVKSYRMDTDSRSKLERRENRILTLDRNDKRNAMDDDQRDGGLFVLNWQYLFYVIQGLYLCSVLLHSNDPKSKIKSRNFGWWNPMYRLKLD
ncbi:PREDICTED: trichohyalin-like [Papilio polytes]|uniref:trichohyalin-like n=1 Tax=Papilio polytes TaxID=76194 RepID=UPI0006767F21|nr:PREDICTED: trichohyalin-like [Papilio polytes]